MNLNGGIVQNQQLDEISRYKVGALASAIPGAYAGYKTVKRAEYGDEYEASQRIKNIKSRHRISLRDAKRQKMSKGNLNKLRRSYKDSLSTAKKQYYTTGTKAKLAAGTIGGALLGSTIGYGAGVGMRAANYTKAAKGLANF